MSLRSRGVGYVRVQSGGNTPLVSGGLAEHSNIGYELRDMASLQSATVEPTPHASHTHQDTESTQNSPVKEELDVVFHDDQPPCNKPQSIQSIIRSWWRELLAISISIASLIATVGVLLTYQHQPLSSWHFHYLPNSVVSQLTTITRSALMFSTASCVSQLSWLHFQQKPRVLSELQAFDSASRGPAGAAFMLMTPAGYAFPALVGSIVTISTLFMEPLTQQILQFPLLNVTVFGNATYPTTQHYAPDPDYTTYGSIRYDSLAGEVDMNTQAAIFNAFLDNPSFHTQFCPANSSLCSWNDTSTLGICSACTNVTLATNSSCTPDQTAGTTCNYTTPSGFTLQGYLFETSEEERWATRINTTARRGSETSSTLVDFATLTQNWTSLSNITECSLSWCAKVYRNATTQNSLFSVDIDQYPLEYLGYYPVEVDTGIDVAYNGLKTGDGFPSSMNGTFTIQSGNSDSLSKFLVTLLNAGTFLEYELSGGQENKFSLGTVMLGNPSTEYMANNIATSLTNVIQNITTGKAIQNRGYSTFAVQHIQVRWIWLSFPATIVLLGVLLLLLTMLQSHLSKAPVWKCSPLALLFHPLQGWSQEELNHASKREMERRAKGMRGQLLESEHVGVRIIKA